ncbi:MAG: hypothetical protein ABGX22_12775 [Pirellulaceae bacterium]
MERRTPQSRRTEDRRQQELPVETEQRDGERRTVQRRRQIDPTTCERDYSDDEIEFMQALDQYKRDNGRMFPTCSEILEVIRALGYFRVDENGNPLHAPIVASETTENQGPDSSGEELVV